MIAVYNNEYTPTDLVLHPLLWIMFAKNGLTGGLTALTDKHTSPEKPNAGFKIGPESIQGRIPFSFNVNLSPFAPIDKEGRAADVFCVDRNNVGVKIVSSDLKTDQFVDMSRDIKNVKITEAYGYGLFNEGRATCSAKNISLDRSWATPERTIVLNK